MDFESEISALQRQIDELKRQRDELEFIESYGTDKVDYSTQLERLQRWCEEMIVDHHKILLVDRIGNKYYYYSDRQKQEHMLRRKLTIEEESRPERPKYKGITEMTKHKYRPILRGPSFDNFGDFMRGSFDKVYETDNFKILLKDTRLKRRQREEIRETINTFILTGEFIYYEF